MARIRTVKPALFRHEELYELEHKTKLPIRIAWVGLFTVVDREGRFEWKPRILKLDILPWDTVDFEKVLKALESADFIRSYEVDGKKFGHIPSWKLHQTVHHTESASRLPAPPVKNLLELPEGSDITDTSPLCHVDSPLGSRKEEEEEEEQYKPQDFDFETIWKEYPRKVEKGDARARFEGLILSLEDFEDLKRAVANYRTELLKNKTEEKFIKHFSAFLGTKKSPKWRDWVLVEPSHSFARPTLNLTPIDPRTVYE